MEGIHNFFNNINQKLITVNQRGRVQPFSITEKSHHFWITRVLLRMIFKSRKLRYGPHHEKMEIYQKLAHDHSLLGLSSRKLIFALLKLLAWILFYDVEFIAHILGKIVTGA